MRITCNGNQIHSNLSNCKGAPLLFKAASAKVCLAQTGKIHGLDKNNFIVCYQRCCIIDNNYSFRNISTCPANE